MDTLFIFCAAHLQNAIISVCQIVHKRAAGLCVSILGTDRGTALLHTGFLSLTVTFWICSISEGPLSLFTNYYLDVLRFIWIFYILFGYLTPLESPFHRYGIDYTGIKYYFRDGSALFCKEQCYILCPEPPCINKFPCCWICEMPLFFGVQGHKQSLLEQYYVTNN